MRSDDANGCGLTFWKAEKVAPYYRCTLVGEVDTRWFIPACFNGETHGKVRMQIKDSDMSRR